MALDTEFTLNFCAGIGPLHLDVVLVFGFFTHKFPAYQYFP